jgi:hypothetical protein
MVALTSEVDRDLRKPGGAAPMWTDVPRADDVLPLRCATCDRELDGDPDEDPTGDAGRPICGECERERNFFAMDIADGDLDGQIDP